MFSQPDNISFQIPDWVNEYSRTYQASNDLNERMAFVINASRKNVEQGSGGPFAAAIFENGTGELVSLGVNLVEAQQSSMLHAEMVAIAVAQAKLGAYDLGGSSSTGYELVASTEPCTMCLGGVLWSGVNRVVTAARDEDAREIGFDEGPKPDDWIKSLNDRGIEVLDDVERESARSVLQMYKNSEGHIYNSRKS
jgi:tRNA(Arg) A34 adenosine deaminase TadA